MVILNTYIDFLINSFLLFFIFTYFLFYVKIKNNSYFINWLFILSQFFTFFIVILLLINLYLNFGMCIVKNDINLLEKQVEMLNQDVTKQIFYLDKNISEKKILLDDLKKKSFLKYLMIKWQLLTEINQIEYQKKELILSHHEEVRFLIKNFK